MRSRIFASCSSSWNRVLHEFSHISAYTAHQSGPVQWFSWDNLDKAGYHLPHMYWDRLCITWEAYRRRETREFRARHEPRFSLPSCKKGIKLLSSISTQLTQVSNNESVLCRQTYGGMPVSPSVTSHLASSAGRKSDSCGGQRPCSPGGAAGGPPSFRRRGVEALAERPLGGADAGGDNNGAGDEPADCSRPLRIGGVLAHPATEQARPGTPRTRRRPGPQRWRRP